MTWREFIMKLESYNLCFGFVVLTQISNVDFGVVYLYKRVSEFTCR
jgi:hypothetical protein